MSNYGLPELGSPAEGEPGLRQWTRDVVGKIKTWSRAQVAGNLLFKATDTLPYKNVQDAIEGLGTFAVFPTAPTLVFGTPGNSSWVYATQTGISVKSGLLVWVHIEFSATPTIGTGSGNVMVANLPYAPNSDYVATLQVGGMNSNWNWTAGYTQVYARVLGSNLLLAIEGDSVNATGVTAAMMTSGASHVVRITGSYLATA